MTHAVNPSLVVAVALAAGVVAQSIAQHLRVPGIVLLLGVGVLLGPDGVGVVRPSDLGGGLHMIVGFAIAVILFEGGLNLEWRRLRREAAAIRALVTAGAFVTWAGGMLAARVAMGWPWSLSILFGSLVIVTGPTVITPLLRRIKVDRKLQTILEAEGVFIDAIGAILALVALEVVVSPSRESLALGFLTVPTRLLLGAGVGLAGGAFIAFVLRFRGVVPEGLENVFTLSLVLAIFQVSNAVRAESGIVAAVAAGLVVGNTHTYVRGELKEFKEQLTVMLIGMLFVLLAADVRVGEVAALGAPGLWVVASLIVVVRPLQVLACTARAGMTWRERAFVSWMAPRGIVAAAVATLFYERLADAGIAGGEAMRALVFLVIAVTVVFQGLSGGLVARWLGVRRPSDVGYVILGAHPLAVELARVVADSGEEVVLIDANPEACREAEEAGLRVFQGNALEERVLLLADLETRRAATATLSNEAVNFMFARKAREQYRVPRAAIAIQRGHGALSPASVRAEGVDVLFGAPTDIALWSVRVRRGLVRTDPWRYDGTPRGDVSAEESEGPAVVPRELANVLLPLAVVDDGVARPLDDRTRIEEHTVVYWLVFTEGGEAGNEWLAERGWTWVASDPAPPSPRA